MCLPVQNFAHDAILTQQILNLLALKRNLLTYFTILHEFLQTYVQMSQFFHISKCISVLGEYAQYCPINMTNQYDLLWWLELKIRNCMLVLSDTNAEDVHLLCKQLLADSCALVMVWWPALHHILIPFLTDCYVPFRRFTAWI